MFLFSSLLNCFVFLSITQAQDLVNDNCELTDGNIGQCLRFEDCPSAVDLVRHKKGTPKRCGFVGKHPIVCCERNAEIKQGITGEISRQKCSELYRDLPPITTTTTSTSTTTALPDNISIEELIAMAIKEEEEAKLSGKPTNTVHKAAVGGVNAKAKEFLHMAVLGYGTENETAWACGGSLISEKHVLTAAHCIHTPLGTVKLVRLGELNIKQNTDLARPQNLRVAKTIIHPDYKAPSVYNDIAIIELSQNVVIDDYVRPGCLNTEQNDPNDPLEPLSATGWGLTKFQGEQADHLQEVTLRLFTFEECQKAYASTSKRRLSNGIDIKAHICAGEAFKDTCQGDSGGPLQIKNKEYPRGYKIIGVTSFGKACGIGNGPSVYIRVSQYVEWIESIVWPVI